MNIVQLIQEKFGQKSKPILILLAGGVGSGKTTLSNKISQAFEDKTVTVFSTDDYHMTFHTSQVNGFDPKSIDSKLLLSDLTKVLSGEDVYAPTVSRERDEKGIQFTRKDNAVLKKTAQIIILEGIHSLAFEDINKIAEIKVWLETADDLRLVRKMQTSEFYKKLSGEDEEGRKLLANKLPDFLKWWNNFARPSHEEFTLPTKQNAGFILDNNKTIEEILKNPVNENQTFTHTHTPVERGWKNTLLLWMIGGVLICWLIIIIYCLFYWPRKITQNQEN